MTVTCAQRKVNGVLSRKTSRKLGKEFNKEEADMPTSAPITTALIGSDEENEPKVGTPTKKSRRNIVTPSTLDSITAKLDGVEVDTKKKSTRRSLVMPPPERCVSDVSEDSLPSLVESSSSSFSDDDDTEVSVKETTKRQPFQSTIVVSPSVKKIYHIVNKMTGSIGGNGSGGAIYGELTVGSMQKMVDLMKQHTQFSSKSRFIDVGCGLSKPNLHVMQDPGVELSYGIEMEEVRWLLGMHNLNHVLKEAHKDSLIQHKCFLAHGNIKSAKTFDPFSHVYMFDIGFPPRLFLQLAKMFNRAKSNYLICYHGPKLMIDEYGFDVELITQSSTSMHGSSENHMGYIYKRVKMTKEDKNARTMKCDPLFKKAWDCTRLGLKDVSRHVSDTVETKMDNSISRRTRSSTRKARAEQ